MAFNKNKPNKGKKCAISTNTTSTTSKWARANPHTVASGGTSSQSSCHTTVATEEEDVTSHGDAEIIEETHNLTADESEAESSEVELGEKSTQLFIINRKLMQLT
jgi:hypothetical protein